MTDGLRKSHLRKAHQVGLSEVGLPDIFINVQPSRYVHHAVTLNGWMISYELKHMRLKSFELNSDPKNAGDAVDDDDKSWVGE